MRSIQHIEKFILTCSKEEAKTIRRLANKRYQSFKESPQEFIIYSNWSLEISKILLELMVKNFPIVKEPDLKQWACDIDKIHRIDKQPLELIEGLMRFSQTDDFWKQQIRSGASLRRHFEKLYIAGKSQYDAKQKGTIHVV